MPQYGGGAVDPFNFLGLIYLLGWTAIIYLAAAAAVGAYAERVGRNSAGWFILALLFTPPMACFMVVLFGGKTGDHLKQCSQCAEAVKRDALLCRYCRSPFAQGEVPQQ